jgi:hypothetical protein
MAKHCDVCNKSYPESEVRCPHCAAAKKAAGDPGSAVNLGEPYVAEVADADGPKSPASASNVEWAALAEEVPDDAPRIDSPSDRDILAHAPTTPPPAAGDAAIGDEPFVAEAADDANSAIDLAALAGQSAGGSSLHESAAPPSDKDEAAAAHFLDDAAEVEAGSGVNLGAPTRPTDRPSSRDLIAEAVESGVDVGGARAAGEAATEEVESSSDRVDLGSPEAGTRAEGHSGPSSEVDLGGKGGRAKRRPASEPTSDVDLAGARSEEPTDLDAEAGPAGAHEEVERPSKARSGAGRALVGGGAGVLVGLALALGLWLFGVEPPAGWKLVQSKGPANAVRQQPLAQNPAPAPGAPAATGPARDPKNGDSVKEIEAYGTLKNYLVEQNLLAKGGDPQKAVETAVQNAAALQARMKKLTDDLGTTPDKLGAGIAALVKDKEEATKKATALATDLTAARKDAKDSTDKLVQAGEQLKTAEDKRKTVEGKLNTAAGELKSVGDRLAAAGVKDADPAKGVDALAAERAAADKVVSAVADKLAAANVKVDRNDVVQGVERVIEVARQNGAKGQSTARPPRSLAAPNPLLAEAHYAAGLRAYFDGRFVDAQSAFAGAVQADDQDARYFYFLGLSRLALDNRADANTNFAEGARLELENRPGRKVVSTALERVQGMARQALNRFRP